MAKPRIAITLGDVNGVGPEILLKALVDRSLFDVCVPVVFGCGVLLETLAKEAGNSIEFVLVDSLAEAWAVEGGVPVFDVGVRAPQYTPGILSAEAGRCAVVWYQGAIAAALAGDVDAIVTCPINKEGIHQAGYEAYQGHTDMLAALTGGGNYRMCLFTDRMRIVHLTGHVALREALDWVKRDRIVDSVRLGRDALVRVAAENKRIAVAGLNPHAGEAGAIGREEIEEIGPAVTLCREEGIDCWGPFPPDTVFKRMAEGEFGMVIAMYHDQGHIPLKLIAMDEGVNVTLGTKVVRTSVDHGTAYDIAGKGVAREGSLLMAVRLAAQLSGTRGETA